MSEPLPLDTDYAITALFFDINYEGQLPILSTELLSIPQHEDIVFISNLLGHDDFAGRVSSVEWHLTHNQQHEVFIFLENILTYA